MTDTAYGNAQDLLVELTADIVAAYVSNHVVPVTELPGLISDVHTALSGTSAPASVAVNVEKQKPAVSVRISSVWNAAAPSSRSSAISRRITA